METNLTFEDYRNLVKNIEPSENCPLQRIMDIFSGKWNMRVLFELTKVDSIRFGNLKKQIPTITNTMLSNTLKELEESELLIRTQYNEIPPHVEYALSDKGKTLYPIFLEMTDWVLKNL